MPEVPTNAGGIGAFGSFVEGLGSLVSAVSPIVNPIIAANFPGRPPVAQPGGAVIPMQGQFADPRGFPVQQAAGAAMLPALIGPGARGLGALGGALGLGAGIENLLDVLPQFSNPFGGSSVPINPVTTTSTRFPRTVSFQTTTASGNPKVVTYRNMGSCLLFSGDLSAAKRVKRIAAKARRRSGGR